MFGKNLKNIKIKTKNGWEPFLGIQKLPNRNTVQIITKNNYFLNCTLDHKINTLNGFTEVCKLTQNDFIETSSGFSQIDFISDNYKQETVFDIIDAGIDNCYFTNNILSHNCEFLGSTNTLIDGSKLQTLVAVDPLDTDDVMFKGMTIPNEMDIFIPPVKELYDDETKKQIDKDHIYAMTVDVSEGKNLDYAAFSVFDISTIPYKQVATYRNNQLHPMLFPDIIKLCAEYYNNAHVLIEINNNPTVADTLYQDLEYENVLKVYAGNKKAQQISESGKATQNGLNMSPLVKRVGCTTLKTLIETDKLQLNSSDTIYELTRFIATNNSFAAEEGANDDLAMTLVIFAWLTTQKLFIELSSTDIRKRLQIENNYAKEEEYDVPPMPQFNNPIMDNYQLEDGDLWQIVETESYYF
jgi:hypothetical protein